MSHNLGTHSRSARHARKVTRKGGMAENEFLCHRSPFPMNGLESSLDWPGAALLYSGLASVKSVLITPRESEVNPLQIQEQKQDPQSADSEPPGSSISLRQLRTIGWTSAMFALLQSLCTAVLTISGIRVAIGLSALAAASGIYAPAKGWHQDAIRIPMLIVATARSRGESRRTGAGFATCAIAHRRSGGGAN